MFDPNQLPVPDLGLACPHCAYPLAGLRRHLCPECGRPFTLEEFIPRGDCPPLIASGKEVRATTEIVELLRVYQVPYVELGDPMQNLFGGPIHLLGRHQPPRIGVPRERYLEVVDLIRRDQQGELMPDPPPATTRQHPWTCPNCREINPPNFEICWNCGEPADEDASAASSG